jgi:hypothetical protein
LWPSIGVTFSERVAVAVNANPSVQPAGVVGTFRLALSTMAVALGGFSLVAVAAAGP